MPMVNLIVYVNLNALISLKFECGWVKKVLDEVMLDNNVVLVVDYSLQDVHGHNYSSGNRSFILGTLYNWQIVLIFVFVFLIRQWHADCIPCRYIPI